MAKPRKTTHKRKTITHVRKKTKAFIRSKSSPKKKTRSKSLAKPKQKLFRSAQRSRPKKKATTRRSRSRTFTTDSTEVLTKIRSKSRLGSRPKTILRGRKYSEPAPKPRAKTTGSKSVVKITNSDRLRNKNYLLKKSETTLSKQKDIRLSKTKSKAKQVTETLSKYARQKFDSLGKSKNNLRLLKLQYTYSRGGKKQKAYFSSVISKLESKEDVDKMLQKLILDFEARLSNYTESGFSNISITGIRMHAYEDE